jgi:hypothetical protein
MVDGYFPSDGHLSASRDQSVYGLKNDKALCRMQSCISAISAIPG